MELFSIRIQRTFQLVSTDTVAGEYIPVPVMQENGGCGVSSAERIREGKLP